MSSSGPLPGNSKAVFQIAESAAASLSVLLTFTLLFIDAQTVTCDSEEPLKTLNLTTFERIWREETSSTTPGQLHIRGRLAEDPVYISVLWRVGEMWGGGGGRVLAVLKC